MRPGGLVVLDDVEWPSVGSALAYFDLGNVLDETGRMQEAINSYKTAIQLAPTYADAHYNLALAYEKLRQPRSALRHWKAYVRLDTVGPWAVHAKATHDHAGLARRVEDMQRIHGIAPNLGGGAP